MNVKQLREALAAYPDDLEILIAKDEEGNGFHHFEDLDIYFVYKDEVADHVVEGVYTDEDIEEEEMDREELEPRLVLWP